MKRRRLIFFCILLCLVLILIYKIKIPNKSFQRSEKNIAGRMQIICLEEQEKGAMALPKNPWIGVILKNEDFSEIYHDNAYITCDSDYQVWYLTGEGIDKEYKSAMAELKLETEGDITDCLQMIVKPDFGRIYLTNSKRCMDFEGYDGYLEIFVKEEGYVLVNHLPLEEYLRGVVPAEMPASYPAEALKAQAVCARSYAYDKLLHPAYEEFGAQLDDSTSFQVYGTVKRQDSTDLAIEETAQTVCMDGEGNIMETWYYSTSMGNGRDTVINRGFLEEDNCSWEYLEKLKAEETFKEVILSVDSEDLEASERMYRWKAVCTDDNLAVALKETLERQWEKNEQSVQGLAEAGDFFIISDIAIFERERGGAVKRLEIQTENGTISVDGENAIRKVLSLEGVLLKDRYDEPINLGSLLPSGYFFIEKQVENHRVVGFELFGGGFGHGRGMSQNGAKELARIGFSWKEILDYFYHEKGENNETVVDCAKTYQ